MVEGEASDAALTGEAVAERLASSRAAQETAGSTAEALAATTRWASPLQWASLLVSGGFVAFAALSGHWQGYDWLFVFLFVVYLANAVGFRRLLRRVP